jgi:hypothetical protein
MMATHHLPPAIIMNPESGFPVGGTLGTRGKGRRGCCWMEETERASERVTVKASGAGQNPQALGFRSAVREPLHLLNDPGLLYRDHLLPRAPRTFWAVTPCTMVRLLFYGLPEAERTPFEAYPSPWSLQAQAKHVSR